MVSEKYLCWLARPIRVKVASVGGPSSIALCEVKAPHPGPGEILVEMEACGICGSDLEKVFGRYGQPSMRLGHEPAGTVVEVGGEAAGGGGSGAVNGGDESGGVGEGGVEAAAPSPAARTGLSRGDRVFAHHHVPCYTCHLCQHGRETMCPQYYKSNLSPCGLSERFVVPAWNVARGGVLKLKDSTTFAEAAMIEPLACCVRAWGKIEHVQGDSVAIFGVGPTGIMHAMLAVQRGSSNVICLDVNDFRLDFAAGIGATDVINSADPQKKERILGRTSGIGGADLSIVATSSLAALRDAIGVTRPGGTVMMFGVPPRGAEMSLDVGDLYSREISLLSSYAASDRDTATALNLIESRTIDVRRLITHTYPLSDSQRAFEHARSGEDAMKIAITRD